MGFSCTDLPRGVRYGLAVLLIAVVCASLPYLRPWVGFTPFLTGGQAWGFTPSDLPSLEGKTFVVTGASAGLGKSTTKWLVKGGGRVIMACRSLEKCKATKLEILHELELPEDATEAAFERMVCHFLDLDSLQAVKASATALLEKEARIDSLVLNAGLGFSLERAVTDDGIERTFGVNHLGHFLFTTLLLERIASSSQPATIVSVSSVSAYLANGVPLSLVELEDEFLYSPFMSYFSSKLANILFANQLQSRVHEEVYVSSVQPGGVATEFIEKTLTKSAKKRGQRSFMWLAGPGINLFWYYSMWDSDRASLSVVAPAVAPWITNPDVQKSFLVKAGFFAPIARPAAMPALAANKTLEEELWEFSKDAIAELMAGG